MQIFTVYNSNIYFIPAAILHSYFSAKRVDNTIGSIHIIKTYICMVVTSAELLCIMKHMEHKCQPYNIYRLINVKVFYACIHICII